jgi:hypothetical protein
MNTAIMSAMTEKASICGVVMENQNRRLEFVDSQALQARRCKRTPRKQVPQRCHFSTAEKATGLSYSKNCDAMLEALHES